MPGLLKNPLRRRAAEQGVRLSDLEIGDILRVPLNDGFQVRWGTHMDWVVADQNHPGFPAGSTTLIARRVIQLLPVDAKEPDNPILYRQMMGNNRYTHSNLHQFLNSGAAAGQWYTAQHPYDTPPSVQYAEDGQNAYHHLPGFLQIFPDSFRSKLLETQAAVLLCDTDGGGSETFSARFFLPGVAEVGLADSQALEAEGSRFPLFTGNSSRLAWPTQAAVDASDYKSQDVDAGAPHAFVLRTPYLTGDIPGCAHSTTGDGGLTAFAAVMLPDTGLRPVCNLSGGTTAAFDEAEMAYTLL